MARILRSQDLDIADPERMPLLPNLRHDQLLTMDSFPLEVHHILAPVSGSFNATQFPEMAERLMRMSGIEKSQPVTISSSLVPSVSPLSHLKAELAQLAEQVASLQEPTASSFRILPIPYTAHFNCLACPVIIVSSHLSRNLLFSPGLDLAEMVAEQRRIGLPSEKDVSGLQLQELPLTTGNDTILCDVSTPAHRPFVPPSLRRKVLSSLHNLSHPGRRATDKLVSERFV
ncbi:unnamed protein product [Schistocephalus solidus]|uniref:Uncharacterized protein n=1 Tax=Schistocephalus solidus TaxID=70667 RepID=A0A183SM84_SCHSO|nr:unnamed protein product [Schistocephalus solidus]